MANVDLAKLRERLGEEGKPISQSELARRLGVAQSTIWRIENGQMELDGPLALLAQHLLDLPQDAAA